MTMFLVELFKQNSNIRACWCQTIEKVTSFFGKETVYSFQKGGKSKYVQVLLEHVSFMSL